MYLKICMIGIGSIGKRHIINIRKVLEARNIKYSIDALRSEKNMSKPLDIMINQQYYRMEKLPSNYDVIFITNPTVLHYETIINVIHKTKHLFIEKPIFDKPDYDISNISMEKHNIYYVACPLRHKKILKYVKNDIIAKNKVISARIISSSYLPNWRKGIDYRETYSASRDMGGGVTKDLIHEWDYAIDLFGIPNEIFHMKGKVSDLEIDSDDVSVYIARYEKMFLEMHLDYIGQKTERKLQIITNKKRYDVDLISNKIYEYEKDILVSQLDFEDEDFYLNEMNYFFDCIEGKERNINTVKNAIQTLRVALK